MQLLMERDTGGHFLVARHVDVCAAPLRAVFLSPDSPQEYVSLLDL